MGETNWRIVILGKTGVGKSSLANTTFGEQLFKMNNTAISETSKCQAETKTINGRSITLIDTPGFFDTDISEEELKPEIIRCITECAPGPHAFCIVLKVDKFTEQEQAVITKISQYFSEEVFQYATVLFTHGDQLAEGQTVEEYFHKNTFASELLKKCGGRCHILDNKHWKNNQQDEYRSNQFQVKELLKTVDQMVEANKGSCYTNQMLQSVEEEIQREEERIRQSSGTLTQDEVREKAKDKVFNNLNTQLAGIATGVLLGALFGSVTAVGEVLLVLKNFFSDPGQLTTLAKLAGKATGVIGTAGGAAVVGVAGGAAAVGVAGGTAVAVGALVLVAAAGAVKGGVAGYHAAEGADTPREAAQRAAETARDQALSPYRRLGSKEDAEYKPSQDSESKKK
ncbi:GTPase IMAP family member 7-like isoform X1 [Eleginops maclovinus]|uniref:GTPase IMAP family member 7-like isoform X1 n=1 Tax=Eleginops maclovinus TaxID=56733 RepID=UPI0030805179